MKRRSRRKLIREPKSSKKRKPRKLRQQLLSKLP